jgi:ATP-dependent RNA helicase RhlE
MLSQSSGSRSSSNSSSKSYSKPSSKPSARTYSRSDYQPSEKRDSRDSYSSSKPSYGSKSKEGSRFDSKPFSSRSSDSAFVASKPKSYAPKPSFGTKSDYKNRENSGRYESKDSGSKFSKPRTERPSYDKPSGEKRHQPSRNTGQRNRPQNSRTESGESRLLEVRPERQSQKQKYMEVDYNILVKKAQPQAIEDYKPSKTFVEHGLSENIIHQLNLKGYTQPTAIQDQAIPHIMESKDIIGIANTGTGKTAAFLLPLIHQAYLNPDKCVLVLAPTRELVTQILKELKSYTYGNKISSTTVIGGESMSNQIANLKKPKNFIIATTGRGLDLIDQGALKIKEVDTIVLDEMDQMLDMGFVRDIRKILSLATNNKHLLFFSATSTKEVETIALEMLNNPVRVSVSKGKATDNVNQDVIEIAEGENKFEKLVEVLSRKEVEKAIVFENTKHGSAKIEKELIKRGFKALAIHGNKTQSQRTKALDALKSNQIDILIATNVAARGLDIPLVSHVINYSLPASKEDYVHRIGRTGRAGEIGQAYTFITHEQKNPPARDPKAKTNKKAKVRDGLR